MSYKHPIFWGGFLSDAAGPGQIPTKRHDRDLNLVTLSGFTALQDEEITTAVSCFWAVLGDELIC